MPEVREVFEMTTKQMEPDIDSWREQERRQRRSRSRAKLGAFAVAAAFVMIVAVLIVTNRSGSEETIPLDQPTAAPTDATTGEPFPVNSAVDRFFVDVEIGVVTPLAEDIPEVSYIAVSPDGTMVAYNGCCDGNDPVSVSSIDGRNSRVVTPEGVDGYGVQWSPDGTMLLYQGRDGGTSELGELFVFEVATEETRQVTDLVDRGYDPWFLAPSFTPDGRSILFHMPRGPDPTPRGWDLWSVPVDGGEPSIVRRDATFGSLSPDGTLAYLDPSPGNWSSDTLLVADVAGGEPRVLVEGHELWTPMWSPDGSRLAYTDFGEAFVVDAASGLTTNVADGGAVTWVDDHTLLVYP